MGPALKTKAFVEMPGKKLHNRYHNQEGKLRSRGAGKGRMRDAFRI